MKPLILFPRRCVLACIRLYQRTLSFDHGMLSRCYPHGFCRFYPSCSQYGYQAIEQYGVWRGSYMALFRIFRCNPFSRGGIDEVPLKHRPF